MTWRVFEEHACEQEVRVVLAQIGSWPKGRVEVLLHMTREWQEPRVSGVTGEHVYLLRVGGSGVILTRQRRVGATVLRGAGKPKVLAGSVEGRVRAEVVRGGWRAAKKRLPGWAVR